MPTHLPTRRAVLGIAAGFAGAPLLAACSGGGGGTDKGTADRNARTKLPTLHPYEPVEPDLPGDAKGLMAGYFRYPDELTRAYPEPPAQGMKQISILYPTFGPVPPPMDRNLFWQGLNKGVGATLKLRIAPAGEYANKFQTTIAGDDLPEIVVFNPNTPKQPQVLDSLFEDLGPYLSGDRVKEFRSLANFPTLSWKYCIANGALRAIPQPRSVSGPCLFYREDLVEKAGADPAPKDMDGLWALMRDVTDARRSRWACANPARLRIHLNNMLGVSNGWSEKGGRFTSAITEEGMKESLDLVARMMKEKLFHPDSVGAEYLKIRDYFTAGKTVLHTDGYAAWDLFVSQIGEKVDALVEPKADGGGDAPHYAGASTQGVTAIRKGLGEKRTRQLLRVLDWLAAPIGTEEHLLRKFGTEGTHFTVEDGIPQLTDKGTAERLDVQYITDAPTILGPAPEKRVRKQHDWHKRVTRDVVLDASAGLFSDTALSKGPALGKIVTDAETEVITGRKPLSHWDEAVAQWRKQGGDAIAEELEKAHAQANG